MKTKQLGQFPTTHRTSINIGQTPLKNKLSPWKSTKTKGKEQFQLWDNDGKSSKSSNLTDVQYKSENGNVIVEEVETITESSQSFASKQIEVDNKQLIGQLQSQKTEL